MSSTFDGLYIARGGVRAARANLNITGQNITNADTDGYTRQRVDQSSLPPCEYGGFWASTGAIYGCGVDTTGTEQLRDAFLDSEYRTQNAKSGESTTEINAMATLEDIFTATTTATSSSKSSVIDVLSNEFSNFVSQLQDLTSGKSSASESAIQEEAKLLATKLNTCAKSLDTTRAQQYSDLSKYGVTAANDDLKSIASLNDQIEKSEASGSPALELKDQRNLLLDKLSQYTSIQVVETPKDIGGGKTIDKMSIYLADTNGNALKDANGNYYTLANENQYAQFSSYQNTDKDDGTLSTNPFDMTHVRLSGLTTDGKSYVSNSGTLQTTSSDSEYNFQVGDTTTKVTIAAGKSLHDIMTQINSTAAFSGKVTAQVVTVAGVDKYLTFTTANGNTLSVNHVSGTADIISTNDMDNSELKSGSFSGYLKLLNESGEYDDAHASDATTTMRGIGYYSQLLNSIAQKFADTMNTINSTNDTADNKPLFTSDGTHTTGITAENIQLAAKWKVGKDDPAAGTYHMTMSKDTANAGDSKDTSYSNINYMISQLTDIKNPINLLSSNSVPIFQGTIQQAFSGVGTMLGQDVSSVQSTDNTNSNLLQNINGDRQQLSSVSIDDEAINLVQYNQSLSASSRFMTAVDECLQTIINNMGNAGRG